MKALLIEVDFITGKRAGGINPRDPALPCHGWQNLTSEPGLEIRLVKDDRDLSQYIGAAGVTILDGKEAINKAIEENIPTEYHISSETILIAHLKEKGISLDILANKKESEIAEQLFIQGLAGIKKSKPRLLE